MSISERRTSTRRTGEIETRKTPDFLWNQGVVGSRKSERGQIDTSLFVRSIGSTDEPIESVFHVQHVIGIERVDIIQDGLFGDESKHVANIRCAGVVVVRTVAGVGAIPEGELILIRHRVIELGCVVVVLSSLLRKR